MCGAGGRWGETASWARWKLIPLRHDSKAVWDLRWNQQRIIMNTLKLARYLLALRIFFCYIILKALIMYMNYPFQTVLDWYILLLYKLFRINDWLNLAHFHWRHSWSARVGLPVLSMWSSAVAGGAGRVSGGQIHLSPLSLKKYKLNILTFFPERQNNEIIHSWPRSAGMGMEALSPLNQVPLKGRGLFLRGA